MVIGENEHGNYGYYFSVVAEKWTDTARRAQSEYLTSLVSGGFTGVVLGIYSVGGTAGFTDFLTEFCRAGNTERLFVDNVKKL